METLEREPRLVPSFVLIWSPAGLKLVTGTGAM